MYFDYYPQYDFAPTPEFFSTGVQDVLSAIIMILLSMFFALVVFSAQYIFQSIGLYNIAKNRGMKNPFIAFIPFANIYYFGKIADDIDATMSKKSNYAVKLLSFYIVKSVLSVFAVPFVVAAFLLETYIFLAAATLITLLTSVFSVCYMIFMYIALYRIYKEYSPDNAVLFEILSVICHVTVCIFIFVIRHNKSGYQIWLENIKGNENFQQEEQSVDFENEAEVIEQPAAEEETVEVQEEYNPFEQTKPEQTETAVEENTQTEQ